MALPDLLTPAEAAAAAPKASPETAARLAAFASAAARTITNQRLTRAAHVEFYQGGESGRLILRNVPVNEITRIAGDPTPALLVTNADRANRLATARVSFTGDATSGRTAVGVELSRVSGGIPAAAQVVAFASYTTVGAVAAAINGLGNGWTAKVAGDLADWPSSDLHAPSGAQSAATGNEAVFRVHVQALSGFEWDDAGIVDIDPSWGVLSPWLWPNAPAEVVRDARVYRTNVEAYRVEYDAGYSTPTNPVAAWQSDGLPGDLKNALLEIVRFGASREASGVNPMFTSRTLGQASYTLDASRFDQEIPPHAMRTLLRYRDRHAEMSR